jgi:hypothetical protein
MDPTRQRAQFANSRFEFLSRGLEVAPGVAAPLRRALGGSEVQRRHDQPLLRAVVQVALDPAPGSVASLDDASAGCLEFGDASRLSLAL